MSDDTKHLREIVELVTDHEMDIEDALDELAFTEGEALCAPSQVQELMRIAWSEGRSGGEADGRRHTLAKQRTHFAEIEELLCANRPLAALDRCQEVQDDVEEEAEMWLDER
jgi:hypothetical protein